MSLDLSYLVKKIELSETLQKEFLMSDFFTPDGAHVDSIVDVFELMSNGETLTIYPKVED